MNEALRSFALLSCSWSAALLIMHKSGAPTTVSVQILLVLAVIVPCVMAVSMAWKGRGPRPGADNA